MNNKLIHGDSVKELNKFEDNSVDLLCTDPPYGYGFMGRDWDKVLPDIKIFEECFRVLKPGSMAFVMSAPRSDVQYRMAEMLERVGFRIDYTPIYWTYATGFPKAMNIGKMLDKQQGNKREEVEDPQSAKRNKTKSDREVYGDYKDTDYKVTKGSSELEGSYAGFQPKPAVEVVIVAMKPIEEKGLLAQAQKNGKAVTWFDDCRIPFDEGDTPQGGYGAMDIGIGKPAETQEYRKTTKRKQRTEDSVFKTSGFNNEDNERAEASPMGRFPANLLVSDDVLDDGTEKKKLSTKGATLKTMTAPDLRDVGKKSKEAIGIDKLSYGQVQNAERVEYEQWEVDETTNGYSRYFSLDNWFSKNIKSLPEPVQKTFPFMIVPKASRSEKDNGLDRNIHPTVKPLTLMNYLVTLGSRKGDVVLEPFAGSGTTALACVAQERDYIAIEREQEYYEIAKARLEKVEEPLKLWEKFSG